MQYTDRDVNRFASSRGSNKQTGFLVRHQLFHQDCVTHCIHSRHYDLVKCHLLKNVISIANQSHLQDSKLLAETDFTTHLWNGRGIFDFFSPQFPLAHTLQKQTIKFVTAQLSSHCRKAGIVLYLFDEAVVIDHSLAREGAQERAWRGIHYLHNVILALAFK